MQLAAIVEVNRVGLLVAHGLDVAIGFHRPVVVATSQTGQVATVGPANDRLQGGRRDGGQLAHGGHPQTSEPGRGGRSDPPQRLDGKGMQEPQFFARLYDDHAKSGDDPTELGRRLGRLRGQLGQKLHGRHADRTRQVQLVGDTAADGGRYLRGRAEQPLRARHVEERLVQRNPLNQRGVVLEHGMDVATHFGVAAVAPGDEHRVRAQLASSHDYRLSSQIGGVQNFHGRVEGIHVDVEDAPRRRAVAHCRSLAEQPLRAWAA